MRNLLVFICLILLSGCGPDIPENDFFPLQKGVIWQYKVTKNIANNPKINRFTMTNLGAVELNGDYEGLPVYIRRSSQGTDYFILQDDSGSHRVAKRTVVELKPTMDIEERKILPGFKDLEEGRFWSVDTQPYALRGVDFHSLPDRGLKQFVMSNEITDVNATVSVPAGTFENCILVTGQGQISMYVDPRLGYQDILITQKEWYAPGIGLVKLTRDEPMDLPMFKGGTIIFELESFKP